LKALNEIFALKLDEDALERYAARLGLPIAPVFIKTSLSMLPVSECV